MQASSSNLSIINLQINPKKYGSKKNMQSSFYKNRGGAGGPMSPFQGTSSEEDFINNVNDQSEDAPTSPQKTLLRESFSESEDREESNPFIPQSSRRQFKSRSSQEEVHQRVQNQSS